MRGFLTSKRYGSSFQSADVNAWLEKPVYGAPFRRSPRLKERPAVTRALTFRRKKPGNVGSKPAIENCPPAAPVRVVKRRNLRPPSSRTSVVTRPAC